MRKFISIVLIVLVFLSSSQAQDTTAPAKSDTVIVDSAVLVDTSVKTEEVISSPVTEKKQTDQPIYKLKPAIDVPYTVVAAGWSLYGFSKIYNKDRSSDAEINALRVSDINGFDRWAADVYHPKAEKTSDAFFYGSMPLPLVLMFDKKIRKDAGKIAFLYIETMSTTGIFYTGSNYIFNRYRPYVYIDTLPMHVRTNGNATNSFIGGHPALVATSAFFTAKVFSDYHPDSKLRWVFWTAAATATAATAYLRHRAGKHFPSDLIVGTGLGTAIGILIPHFHKNPLFKKRNVTVIPFTGESHGLVARYKF